MTHRLPLKAIQFLWSYLRRYPTDMGKTLAAVIFSAASILALGFGLKRFIDGGFTTTTAQDDHALWVLVGLGLGVAGMAYVRTTTTARLAERIAQTLKEELFARALRLTQTTYESLRVGDLLTRFSSDVEHVRHFISASGPVAIRSVLQLLGGLGLLVHVSLTLTGVVLAILPLIVLPISLLGKRVQALTRRVQDYEGQIQATIEEHLSAIALIATEIVTTRCAVIGGHALELVALYGTFFGLLNRFHVGKQIALVCQSHAEDRILHFTQFGFVKLRRDQCLSG
jgi:ATP-binding cassette subfamily B protein